MANQNNAQQAKKSPSSSHQNEGWQNWANWQNWQNWPNMQNWGSWYECGKVFGSFMDYSKMRQSTGKNAETATAANRVAIESMQALASRAVEVAQENTKQTMECFRDVCNSKSPEEWHWCQRDFVSNMIQNYCDNVRDATQISAKATEEIVRLWKHRANEAMSECNN